MYVYTAGPVFVKEKIKTFFIHAKVQLGQDLLKTKLVIYISWVI
jgi:hypothetical protein